jgi:GntR family transcriptional regulator
MHFTALRRPVSNLSYICYLIEDMASTKTPARNPAKPSVQPLYLQIKSLLVDSLEEGRWKPGEAIPSETELASQFGVAQGTVRKAVEALAQDNLLLRRQGRGTFVATHTEEKTSHFRFLRIRRDDDEEEYPNSRLLDVRRAKATAEIARILDLKPGDATIVIRRVLEYSGTPAVLDEIVLPAALFKGLTRARLQGHRGSMYGFFETAFGVRMLKAQERLKAIAADSAAASALGVPVGQPLLSVERVTRTFGDRPVEWRRGLCSTRIHHYLNELG